MSNLSMESVNAIELVMVPLAAGFKPSSFVTTKVRGKKPIVEKPDVLDKEPLYYYDGSTTSKPYVDMVDVQDNYITYSKICFDKDLLIKIFAGEDKKHFVSAGSLVGDFVYRNTKLLNIDDRPDLRETSNVLSMINKIINKSQKQPFKDEFFQGITELTSQKLEVILTNKNYIYYKELEGGKKIPFYYSQKVDLNCEHPENDVNMRVLGSFIYLRTIVKSACELLEHKYNGELRDTTLQDYMLIRQADKDGKKCDPDPELKQAKEKLGSWVESLEKQSKQVSEFIEEYPDASEYLSGLGRTRLITVNDIEYLKTRFPKTSAQEKAENEQYIKGKQQLEADIKSYRKSPTDSTARRIADYLSGIKNEKDGMGK